MVLSQITCSFFSVKVLQNIDMATAGAVTRAEVSRIVDGGDSTN